MYVLDPTSLPSAPMFILVCATVTLGVLVATWLLLKFRGPGRGGDPLKVLVVLGVPPLPGELGVPAVLGVHKKMVWPNHGMGTVKNKENRVGWLSVGMCFTLRPSTMKEALNWRHVPDWCPK